MIRLLTICFAFALFACNSSNPSESTGGFGAIAPLMESEVNDDDLQALQEIEDAIREEAYGVVTIDALVGTYKLGSPEEGGGIVWVRKKNDTQLEFALEAYRGAPSYNSGSADGILDFQDTGDMIWSIAEFGDECKLTFSFKENHLDLMQDGASLSCGFGANVYAGGTYKKISSEEPEMPDYY